MEQDLEAQRMSEAIAGAIHHLEAAESKGAAVGHVLDRLYKVEKQLLSQKPELQRAREAIEAIQREVEAVKAAHRPARN